MQPIHRVLPLYPLSLGLTRLDLDLVELEVVVGGLSISRDTAVLHVTVLYTVYLPSNDIHNYLHSLMATLYLISCLFFCVKA